LIGPAALDEMLSTVPVAAGGIIDYGLGIYVLDLPGCSGMSCMKRIVLIASRQPS
jgi:hypothetical protein